MTVSDIASGLATRPLEAVLAAYRPVVGAADELIDPAGNVRPVWRDLLYAFDGFGIDGLRQRRQRAEQYLQDAGVYFRAYGADGSVTRAWPLSHVPVVLSEADWRVIEAGVIQRAELLEAVVADLYGPGRLVADGHLPARLVAQMPEWLRPMVGIWPRSGHFLDFVAFEIGRGPGGDWWVLGDRTQAPAGAGFAIENRIAMSRMLPEFFAEGRIVRIGGFFQALRGAFEQLGGAAGGRIGVLTPGLMNAGYFEHAYIARYLGFALLEGEDLAVRNDRVMVRTVEGLQPVDLLWRRLDAAFADPVELDSQSRLGTPGLVGVLRRQGVSIVNALGTGVLETRAMLAFLPRICQALRGEPLILPNIATWWCGQPEERAHVKAHVERMMIGPALTSRLPFDADEATFLGSRFRSSARQSVEEWLDREAASLVGQEAVQLSTTPALDDGRLVPRPISLRVFAVRTPSGWQVMPGGYARIGRSADSTAISLQRGGSVADVWVVRDQATRLSLELRALQPARSEPGELPSRAADNLYWLGRYVERAEGTMRLLRGYHRRLSEAADPETPLLAALAETLSAVDVDVTQPIPDGLIGIIGAAVQSAAQVRDRFSQDGWVALTDLHDQAKSLAGKPSSEDGAARAIGHLLRQVTGFSGLVQDNMYRFVGWRFLSFGRALERASGTCRVLADYAAPEVPLGAYDLVLEFGDSAMTHRRRYTISGTRETVVELLALDARNPRAIRYQIDRLTDLGETLNGGRESAPLPAYLRTLIRMQTDFRLQRPETLDSQALRDAERGLAMVSDLLADEYLR